MLLAAQTVDNNLAAFSFCSINLKFFVVYPAEPPSFLTTEVRGSVYNPYVRIFVNEVFEYI